MKHLQLPLLTALSALLASTGACILVDDTETNPKSDNSSSSATGGSGGSASAAGGGGEASTGTSTGTGGSSTSENGPGPSQDLAPEATASGEHVCAGCPTAAIVLDDIDAGQVTTYAIDGKVSGEVGHGKFLVLNDAGQFAGGGLMVDAGTGDFSQEIPLFCGDNVVKMYFENDAGRSTFVRRVTSTGCITSDVRVTVAWDETTRHWGTHLVRFGGTLENQDTDCRSSQNCYPGSNQTDWGVAGNMADNPVQDLSRNYIEMAVENIYYPGAEDGLTVVVDNKDDFGSLTPAGTVYVNVGSQPTYVRQLEAFQPKHVYTVADVDGASGTFTWRDEMYDCSADWDLGTCGAVLP